MTEYGIEIRWNDGTRERLWYRSRRDRNAKRRALLRGMLVLSVQNLKRG